MIIPEFRKHLESKGFLRGVIVIFKPSMVNPHFTLSLLVPPDFGGGSEKCQCEL
jgi:hypothetical protein